MQYCSRRFQFFDKNRKNCGEEAQNTDAGKSKINKGNSMKKTPQPNFRRGSLQAEKRQI